MTRRQIKRQSKKHHIGKLAEAKKSLAKPLPEQQRPRRRIAWLLPALLLLILVASAGFAFHPTCTQNCQNKPAYFYGVPIPHSSYSQFYDTENNGQPIHNSSSSNDNGEHPSNEGNFHEDEP